MNLAGFVRKPFPACEAAGVTPRFLNFRGDDPLSFVLSLNLHRRHLTDAQKAVIALNILPHLEQQARERMLRGQVSRGIRIMADPEERIPQGRADQSRDQAAEKVGVNPRRLRAGPRLSAARRTRRRSPGESPSAASSARGCARYRC